MAVIICVWKEKFETIFRKTLSHTHILKDFFVNTLTNTWGQFILFRFTAEHMFSLIRGLYAEYYEGSEYSYDICTSILELLILKALSSTRLDLISPNDIKDNAALLLPTILQYIHDHHNQLTLETLAETFHYNPEYLIKKLKSATGKSFQTLLTEERIHIAIQMMINTALTLEEMGVQVGNNSPAAFSRAFKNTIGSSPGQYRKDYRVY